jgi:hypothetical protein
VTPPPTQREALVAAATLMACHSLSAIEPFQCFRGL